MFTSHLLFIQQLLGIFIDLYLLYLSSESCRQFCTRDKTLTMIMQSKKLTHKHSDNERQNILRNNINLFFLFVALEHHNRCDVGTSTSRY